MNRLTYFFIMAVSAISLRAADLPDLFKVVVVGDSISCGFGVAQEKSYIGLLKSRLISSVPGLYVINLSKGGSDTRILLQGAGKMIRRHYSPKICVLALGGNDFLQGVEPLAVEERLVESVGALKTSHEGCSFVLLGFGYASDESNPFKRAAARLGIECIVDFEWEKPLKSEWRLADGVHPNEKGHEEIAARVASVILRIAEHSATTN